MRIHHIIWAFWILSFQSLSPLCCCNKLHSFMWDSGLCMDVRICAHSAPKALVKSGTDVGSGGLACSQRFILKVFTGVEVKALWRILEFFHTNLRNPDLYGFHSGIWPFSTAWYWLDSTCFWHQVLHFPLQQVIIMTLHKNAAKSFLKCCRQEHPLYYCKYVWKNGTQWLSAWTVHHLLLLPELVCSITLDMAPCTLY